MGKRIAIVSIFNLTRVFHQVSHALTAAGHEVFWITTDRYWTGWLESQGVQRERILELVFESKDFLDDAAKEKLLADIVADESACDLTINQIFMMDQFVMHKNLPRINDYAFLYYQTMRDFLAGNRITHLIAEPTNTNEMVAYMVCRRLGIHYISPCDMRHPPRRLIFVDSYLQRELIPRRTPEDHASGKTVLEQFADHSAPPPYFIELNKQRVLNIPRIARSILNRITRNAILRRPNLTHHDLSGRIGLLRRRVVNGFVLRHLFTYDRLDEIKGRIAYYPLHVQPESSIDVLGSYFSDQLKLIKDIRRALPFDVTLVVKEHPNFLGTKELSLYRAIRRIPNVKLVRHDESGIGILKKSAILFTVSGTAALEAGMLGIPAVVFCEMYFNRFSSIHYCSDLSGLRELAFRLLGSFQRDFQADCDCMEYLMANSYDAFWTDPMLYPSALSEENIARLQKAFLSVVEHAGS